MQESLWKSKHLGFFFIVEQFKTKSQNSMVEKLKVEALSKMKECDDDGKRIIEKNKTLEQKILALEIQNNEKNNQLTSILNFSSKFLIIAKALKKQIFEVKNENMRLEKQVMIKQSQNIRIESLKEREEKLAQENQDYRSQIGLLSDQVLLQDSKTLDLHNTIKELKSSVAERDDVFFLFFFEFFKFFFIFFSIMSISRN